MVIDALLHPFKAHFGFIIIDDPLVTCEVRAAQFERERNAYISGFSLFLFLCARPASIPPRFLDLATRTPVGHISDQEDHRSFAVHSVLRRLVDIQMKLHEARSDSKAANSGVPMGRPVQQPAKSTSKFD